MAEAKVTTPIREIRARADAASPGPWRVVYEMNVEDADGHAPLGFQSNVEDTRSRNRRNAEFIAGSRTDVPELCDEVERLENVILRAHAAYTHYKTYLIVSDEAKAIQRRRYPELYQGDE